MRLAMAGLDYTTAAIGVRGMFAPGEAARREALRAVAAAPGVAGCALVATCNRTELYVSYAGGVPPDSVRLLCDSLGQDAAAYRAHFIERCERQAAEHLMRVAAGLLSGVPGDDQIVTQVRAAVETAREAEVAAADPLIEALFRAAVAAGKKVKSSVSFARDHSSVAERAAEEIAARLAPLRGKRALVIGNGTIGVLVATRLLEKGCAVAMTLRDARRKSAVPQGCAVVEYDARLLALGGCDVVVSATSSPGFTVTAEALCGTAAAEAGNSPGLFVDLAVPRDIDPEVAELGAAVLNVDDLRGGFTEDAAAPREAFAKAEAIIRDEAERFDLWRRNRRRYAGSNGDPDAGSPDFPIFINLHQAPVLIAGGGKVAARRAEKLLAAGALVHVVAPSVCAAMEKLLENGAAAAGLRWSREEYAARHMDGVTLAVAATDRRDVNAAVGADARARGVLVSVADNSRECTFYFPAIVKSDFLTAGLVSNNGDHAMVKRAAARVRTEMESIDADYQSGKS